MSKVYKKNNIHYIKNKSRSFDVMLISTRIEDHFLQKFIEEQCSSKTPQEYVKELILKAYAESLR